MVAKGWIENRLSIASSAILRWATAARATAARATAARATALRKMFVPIGSWPHEARRTSRDVSPRDGLPMEVCYCHTLMTQSPPTVQPNKLLARNAAHCAATPRPRGGSKECVTQKQKVATKEISWEVFRSGWGGGVSIWRMGRTTEDRPMNRRYCA